MTSAGGMVELFADGSFSYTGSAGYSGSDSFTYSAIDPDSHLSAEASVFISNIFDQPNRPPTAVDDVVDMQGEKLASINVLANDSDLDHNPITAQLQTLTTV